MILDIDWEEEWTIKAFNNIGDTLDTIVLGPNNELDGSATSWSFNFGTPVIKKISLSYTGSPPTVGIIGIGLAFDNFTPSQGQDKYKNLGIQNNESDVGEPFNLTTGNVYTYPSHDIIIKGRLPIDFYRIYNSQSDYSSALGYGWNHSYDIFLLDIDSNSIRVNIEDGKSIYFFKNPNDIYTPMAGYAAHSLVKKPDGSFTYRIPQGKKYQFNSNGKLILIEDRNANTLTCAYDEMGRLTSITDGSDRNITFTYHSNDTKIRTITDPAGRIVVYSYDGSDNLVTVTNPDGTQIRYEYNDPYDIHNLTKVIDENDHIVVSYQYDAQDRVTFSERENGVDALTITYNSSNQTTLTNSKGEEIIYIFASIDGTKVITNIAGAGCRTCDTRVSSIFYDENLNRTLEIDRNGNSTGYTYDDNGNMLTQSNPKRYFTYDLNFNLVKTAQEFPPGIVKYFTYDSRGNLLSATSLLNLYPTTYEYNNFGDLIKQTDPKGDITTFTYNQYGYLISETDAIGNTTHYTYDIIGNLLSTTNPRGDTTSYTYDLMNRVIKVILPDGNSIDYTYDSVGNRISVTDQNGNIVTTTYDAADRVIAITNPSQESIVYSYDTESNRTRTEILDSIGQIITYTEFEYDNQNRLIAETDANNNQKNYTYDLAGNLISSVDGNGNETRYEYDKKNRIVKVINPLGGTIRNTYDFVKDYLTSICDPNGNIITYDYKFYYDRWIFKIISPDTGTTTNSYDKNGNLFEKTDADGIKTVYDYDPLNRLTKISSQGTEYVKYSYDSIGNITLMEDTSGITKFEYDRIGNIIKEAKTIKDETYCYETDYTYDAANRLISITYPSGIERSSILTTRITGLLASQVKQVLKQVL